MGPLSLLLRAPAVALAGASSVWGYRLGALVCLLAVIALGGLIAQRAGTSYGVIAAILLVVNPVSIDALRLGHPEERLGSALCVIALLLARERQVTRGGVALGAALATKQWALIAIAPVLLAAPREGRMRVALAAGGVAAAIIGPLALADPRAFLAAMHHPAFGVAEMRTGNLWGWAAITGHISLGGGDTATTYVVPGWLQHVAHPLRGAADARPRCRGVALAQVDRPARAARAADAPALRAGPVEPRLLPRPVPGGADRLGGARGAPHALAFGDRRGLPRDRVQPPAAGFRRAVRAVGGPDGALAQPACPALGAAAGAPASPAGGRLAPPVARRARCCSGRSTPYHETVAIAKASGRHDASAPSGDSGSAPWARRNSSSGTCHR